MDINYKFIPEFKTEELKRKFDIISYAGKLLEILDCKSALITLDDENRPLVYEFSSKALNALEFELKDY